MDGYEDGSKPLALPKCESGIYHMFWCEQQGVWGGWSTATYEGKTYSISKRSVSEVASCLSAGVSSCTDFHVYLLEASRFFAAASKLSWPTASDWSWHHMIFQELSYQTLSNDRTIYKNLRRQTIEHYRTIFFKRFLIKIIVRTWTRHGDTPDSRITHRPIIRLLHLGLGNGHAHVERSQVSLIDLGVAQIFGARNPSSKSAQNGGGNNFDEYPTGISFRNWNSV